MGASLVETKRRIKTVTSTEKITKAMKLVASVRYQKWKRIYSESLPYTEALEELLSQVLSTTDKDKIDLSSYTKKPVSDKKLYVVVTSTLGLCGSYNYNLFRMLDPILTPKDDLILLGTRGVAHYQQHSGEKDSSFEELMKDVDKNQVTVLRKKLVSTFFTGKYSEIVLCYTKYVNSLDFEPVLETYLPYKAETATERTNGFAAEMIPSPSEVVSSLLPMALDQILYDRLLTSITSEQASRRNAMETATDNADDLIRHLHIVYNKSRQEKITQEITEVIAGSKNATSGLE
ncbi:MAG: ATP synthase F1 subunit gamma, partial [Bacilli bacterium]